MTSIQDLTTPALIIDKNRLEKNCQRMARYCIENGVELRPHVKTHKCKEIAEITTNFMKNRKITVSTVAEAEFFAKNGFNDILLAHFVTDITKAKRLQQLVAKGVKLHVFVDSLEHLELLEKFSSEKWSVFLELDPGYKRTGADPYQDSTLKLAEILMRKGFLSGIYVHEGQSYYVHDNESAAKLAMEAGELAMEFVGKLGIEKLRKDSLTISIGSTPSIVACCNLNLKLPVGIREIHPGSFCLLDGEQYSLGTCKTDDIAIAIATRIISKYKCKKQLVVDSGFTSLSFDLGNTVGGKNGKYYQNIIIKDHPELALFRVTQELAIIKAKNEEEFPINFDQFQLGQILFIYPYTCTTVCDKFNEFFVMDSSDGNMMMITDVWKPIHGW